MCRHGHERLRTHAARKLHQAAQSLLDACFICVEEIEAFVLHARFDSRT